MKGNIILFIGFLFFFSYHQTYQLNAEMICVLVESYETQTPKGLVE